MLRIDHSVQQLAVFISFFISKTDYSLVGNYPVIHKSVLLFAVLVWIGHFRRESLLVVGCCELDYIEKVLDSLDYAFALIEIAILISKPWRNQNNWKHVRRSSHSHEFTALQGQICRCQERLRSFEEQGWCPQGAASPTAIYIRVLNYCLLLPGPFQRYLQGHLCNQSRHGWLLFYRFLLSHSSRICCRYVTVHFFVFIFCDDIKIFLQAIFERMCWKWTWTPMSVSQPALTMSPVSSFLCSFRSVFIF